MVLQLCITFWKCSRRSRALCSQLCVRSEFICKYYTQLSLSYRIWFCFFFFGAAPSCTATASNHFLLVALWRVFQISQNRTVVRAVLEYSQTKKPCKRSHTCCTCSTALAFRLDHNGAEHCWTMMFGPSYYLFEFE